MVTGLNLTDLEFAEKLDYEGDALDGLEYGLSIDDFADKSSDLAQAWGELENLWRYEVQPLVQRVYEAIDALEGDE